MKRKLLKAAKGIKHCGDYGDLYFNRKTKEVCLVLGDCDGDVDSGHSSFEDIRAMLMIEGVSSVEISDESAPSEEDGFENLGQIGEVV